MGNKKKHHDDSPPEDASEAFEPALEETEKGVYVLRLYISGLTPTSQRAVENVHKICAEHLEGRYQLETIDIYQQPLFARQRQIVAAPTLVKERPLPLRKFIGDMSKTEKILSFLGVRTKKSCR